MDVHLTASFDIRGAYTTGLYIALPLIFKKLVPVTYYKDPYL